jgi:hypothetical protein
MKMKPGLLIIIFLLILTSCNPKAEEPAKPKLKKNDALIIGNPLNYGMENLLLFPVGANYKPEVVESENKPVNEPPQKKGEVLSFTVNVNDAYYDRSASQEYVNTDEDKFDIRNILFYDLKTGKTYPLLSDTLHILSFALHKEFEKPLIFYRIVRKDINHDSIFNSSDPVMLFISDLSGTGLIQITPDEEKFVDYTYYPQTKIILVRTIVDTDRDGQFTMYDETNFREMPITAPAMGKEIFNKSLKDSLRKQLKVL